MLLDLASFIVRLLALPPTDKDFFTDDTSRWYEATPTGPPPRGSSTAVAPTVLPRAVIPGAVGAVTLARALQLPEARPTTTRTTRAGGRAGDQRLANSGLIPRCAEGLFCPTTTVIRGRMVRYLHSAFAPPG